MERLEDINAEIKIVQNRSGIFVGLNPSDEGLHELYHWRSASSRPREKYMTLPLHDLQLECPNQPGGFGQRQIRVSDQTN